MSVTKRGNSFQATVHFKGERYRKTFATKAEATAWEHQLMGKLVSGVEVRQADMESEDPYQTMTLGGLLELTHLRVWKGTAGERTALLNARKCIDALGAHLPPSAVNEARLDKMVLAFEMEGSSPATINRRISALSKMMTVAYDRRIITKRPKFERKKEPAFRNRQLSAAEEENLLSMLTALGHTDMADFCIMAIDTGVRAGEMLKLTAQMIQDDALFIPAHIAKNGQARLIPLTDRAKTVLNERVKKMEDPIRDKLFQGFTYDMARYYWDVVRFKLGYQNDPHFVIHVMRHTFCSRLLQAGVDVFDVSRLAGHKSLAVTMRYVASSRENLRLAINKMQEKMQGTNRFQQAVPFPVDSNLQDRHMPQAVA